MMTSSGIADELKNADGIALIDPPKMFTPALMVAHASSVIIETGTGIVIVALAVSTVSYTHLTLPTTERV